MDYDVLILGGGPAGLTAALYAARGGLTTLLVEKFAAGGQANQTPEIENYPGIEKIAGQELTEAMRKQAEAAGAKILYGDAEELDLRANPKTVKVGKDRIAAKTVILATGASPRKLGIPKEDEKVGMGISYCATCDGAFFRGKAVAVVGGGNTAVTDALYLQNIASEVTLIHRRNEFRAAPVLVKRLSESKVKRKLEYAVTELSGEPLESVKLKHLKTGEVETLPVRGLFIAVGRVPDTGDFPSEIKNKEGFLLTDAEMRTSIAGVFAAGDAREKTLRQVVTAAADGAIAAESAMEYLRNLTEPH